MDAAQTKGHEADKHTEMHGKKKEKKRKTKNEKRELGSKAQGNKQARKRTPSIATNLPVSATKPRRGPCHTICHFLPALVGNGMKCHCCRCRPP